MHLRSGWTINLTAGLADIVSAFKEPTVNVVNEGPQTLIRHAFAVMRSHGVVHVAHDCVDGHLIP